MTTATMASMATGSQKLIGPALIALGTLFPIILLIPLLKTKILFFTYNEIILLRAAYDLFFVDKFLFIVVFVFGMLLPATKMVLSILCWYRFSIPIAQRWADRLALLSKLSSLMFCYSRFSLSRSRGKESEPLKLNMDYICTPF